MKASPIAAALALMLSAGSGFASEHGLTQDAYIWQRAWTPAVVQAAKTHGTNFDTVVALAAEMTWRGSDAKIAWVPIEFSPWARQALEARHSTRLGLALRIGPVRGSFGGDARRTHSVTRLAQDIVELARTNGVTLSELQLDFDAAESQLTAYRTWVQAVRSAIAPVPLVITALPSWLSRREFAELARAADGYVLQVHSVEKPRSISSSFTLCDPSAARASVRRASAIGVPFRVALPTYGYWMAFHADGKFAGLSAEGPAREWPSDARVRQVLADPMTLAPLVADWLQSPPPHCRGLIWYRLPVEGDRLNWRWPTLDAVRSGTVPQPKLKAAALNAEPTLVDIELRNDGTAEVSGRIEVTMRWKSPARMIAGDGLAGFSMQEAGAREVRWSSSGATTRWVPGERRRMGWARFSEPVSVSVEVNLATDGTIPNGEGQETPLGTLNRKNMAR